MTSGFFWKLLQEGPWTCIFHELSDNPCAVWGCAHFRSSLLWEDPDPKTGYPKKPLRLTPCRMG